MSSKIFDTVAKELTVLIKKIVSDAIASVKYTDCIEMKLISINPVRFQKSVDIIATLEMVVLPKGKVFVAEDVGKTYVFIQANQGQMFYFLYERS